MFYKQAYIMESVKAHKLTKTYKLYEKPINRLKEIIFGKPFHEEFTALSDVSFALKKGETLGVVGDNGAGKSTLLKILSKTLRPSSGDFTVNGVTASLLELGTGFHPEFSGEENVFFYGSLLGIDSKYLKQRLSHIVEFAELGEFINYPVKTYSSGMYVRLAFSVATNVEPDILIIDEALSVGDQSFQKKCLDRMGEFKRQNKTIIFCSHDLYQVKSFCDMAIWLQNGQVQMQGEASQVVNAYMSYEQRKIEQYKTSSELFHKPQEGSILFIKNLTAKQPDPYTVEIKFILEALEPHYGHIGWAIFRKDKLKISFMTTKAQGLGAFYFNGSKDITINIRDLNIVNDTYMLYVGILDKEAFKPLAIECIEFTINTGLDVFTSVCHLNSVFVVK